MKLYFSHWDYLVSHLAEFSARTEFDSQDKLQLLHRPGLRLVARAGILINIWLGARLIHKLRIVNILVDVLNQQTCVSIFPRLAWKGWII